jgi:hypothetical protein
VSPLPESPPPAVAVLRPAATFREKVVLTQGVVMILLLAAIIFLVVRLTSAQDADSCNITRAARAAAVQDARATYGNEGRAAATALATSVIAAAASPAGIRTGLIETAEKVYSNAMITVSQGLAANPVAPASMGAC